MYPKIKMRDPGRGPPFKGSHRLVWLLICILLGCFLIASYETLRLALCGLFSTVSTMAFLSRHPGMAIKAGASLSTSVGQQALQVLYASATGCSELLGWGLMPICLICAPHIMLCFLAEGISLLFRYLSLGGDGGTGHLAYKPWQLANSLIYSIADLYFNPRFTDLVLYISKSTASLVFLVFSLVLSVIISTIAAVLQLILDCFSRTYSAFTPFWCAASFVITAVSMIVAPQGLRVSTVFWNHTIGSCLQNHLHSFLLLKRMILVIQKASFNNISNSLLSLYDEAACTMVPRVLFSPGIQICSKHPTLELNFSCNNFNTIWSTWHNVLSATSISELLSLNLNAWTTTRNPGLAYFYHLTTRILPVNVPAASLLPEILVLSLTMVIWVYLTMVILAYLIRRIYSRAPNPTSLTHEANTAATPRVEELRPVVTGAPLQPDNIRLDEDDVSDDDENVNAGMHFPVFPKSSNEEGHYWNEPSLLRPLRPPHCLVGGATDSDHSLSSNSANDDLTSSPRYKVNSDALERLKKMKNKPEDFRDEEVVRNRDRDVLEMVATALNQREEAKGAQAKTNTTLPIDDRNLDATTKNLQQLDNVLTIVFTLQNSVALSSLLTVLRDNKIIVLPSGNPQIRTGRGDAVCAFQQYILYIENSGSGHGTLAKLLLGRLNLTVEGQTLHAHIYGGEKLTRDGGIKELRLSFNNHTTTPHFNNAPLDKVTLLNAPDAKSTLLISLCALGVSLPLIHEIILACLRRAGIQADFIRMDTMRNENNPRTGRKTLWINNDPWDYRCGIVLQFLSEADYNRAMALLSNSTSIDITFLPGMACLAEGNDRSLGLYPPSTIKVRAFEPSNRARGHARAPAQAQLPDANNITNTLWIYWIPASLTSTDNESVSAEVTAIYTKILWYMSVVLRFPSLDTSNKRSFQREVSNLAPRVAAALNQLGCGVILDIFLSSQQDSQSGPFSSPVLTGFRVTVDSNSNALKMVDCINKGGLTTLLELACDISATGKNPDGSITDFLRQGAGTVKVCAQLLVDCPPETTATTPPLPRGLARAPPSQTSNTGRKQKSAQKSFAEAARGNQAPAARSASNSAQAARRNQAAEAPPTSPVDAARRPGGQASVAPPPVSYPPSVPSSATPPSQPLTTAQIREMVSSQVKTALEASARGGSDPPVRAGLSEPFIRKLVADSVKQTVDRAMAVLESDIGRELEQVKNDINEIHIKLNQSSCELSAMQLKISGETQESIRFLSNKMDTQLTEILERLPLPTRSRAQSQPLTTSTGSRVGVAIFSRQASPADNDASSTDQE
jgi:hypothetical protein